MATTMDYINQLKADKQNAVSMLNNMGVEASDSETFTSLVPKIGKIVTDPILQDKSITITENGTTNILADEGYDGLNNVEVTTNIESSGGGETPEKGFVIKAWDTSGYPTKMQIIGIDIIPSYAFSSASSNTKCFVGSKLEEVILPESTTNIQQYAFAYCENLVNINLTNNLTIIGANAFNTCTNLALTNLPDSLTTIETYTFFNCRNLALTSLPNSLISIGSYAFNTCSNLALTSLPDNLTSIESYAFQRCGNLALTSLPDGVKSIGKNTFAVCTGLKQLSFNASISATNASNSAFYNCSGLRAVWIGDLISALTQYAFCGCSKLKYIYINKPRTTVESFAGYSYKFINNTSSTIEIICNDDEGFMTKAEFDAIDWVTYTA